jgi:hypothetical protein
MADAMIEAAKYLQIRCNICLLRGYPETWVGKRVDLLNS